MTTTRKRMTAEALAALPGDGRRYELLDGGLHEMPPAGPEHDGICGLITLVVGQFIVSQNVYPDTRSVLAYRSPTDVRRSTDAGMPDAGPVLPGFACPVAQVFPAA